jgi:uncharacterized membrane protein YqjE
VVSVSDDIIRSGETRTGYDPATQPIRPEASLGQLFGEMTSDMSRLFRDEVELAKVETREELAKAKQAGVMFGGAGLAGWMAVVFLSFAAAWLLDQAMNRALAFLIVAVVWAIAAFVLISIGKKRAAALSDPIPQTKQTIKEDVQWAKAQKS